MNRCYSFLFFLICLVAPAVAREAIIDGAPAQIDQFPYLVSLQIENQHICGGGIIGDRFILTAAHCVYKNGSVEERHMVVLAGTQYLQIRDKAITGWVKKIFVPKAYSETDNYPNADIAVLMLNHNFEFPLWMWSNKNLKKLQLPEKEHGKNGHLEIAGFGWNWIKTTYTGFKYGSNNRLRYAFADILTECHHEQQASVKHICARVKHNVYHPRGTCNGDDGSPLVYKRKRVIGILSKHPDDCLENLNGSIYTLVSSHLQFIKNALNDHMTADMHILQHLIPASIDSYEN